MELERRSVVGRAQDAVDVEVDLAHEAGVVARRRVEGGVRAGLRGRARQPDGRVRDVGPTHRDAVIGLHGDAARTPEAVSQPVQLGA